MPDVDGTPHHFPESDCYQMHEAMRKAKAKRKKADEAGAKMQATRKFEDSIPGPAEALSHIEKIIRGMGVYHLAMGSKDIGLGQWIKTVLKKHRGSLLQQVNSENEAKLLKKDEDLRTLKPSFEDELIAEEIRRNRVRPKVHTSEELNRILLDSIFQALRKIIEQNERAEEQREHIQNRLNHMG